MVVKNKNTEIIQENNIIKIIKGSVLAIIITLISLLVLALLLAYTSVSENIIKPVIIVITGISIWAGSIFSSIKIRKQGILNGTFVGSIYIITIYLLSSIFEQNFSVTMNTIIMVIVGILSGAIGGVIGVNLKHNRK